MSRQACASAKFEGQVTPGKRPSRDFTRACVLMSRTVISVDEIKHYSKSSRNKPLLTLFNMTHFVTETIVATQVTETTVKSKTSSS